MNFDQIKTFLSLYETKNFNRTAEFLFISQPTVTVRIKSLEDEVGQQLFYRDNKHVELTPIGERFLPYATQLYKSMTESQMFLMHQERFANEVKISAPGTVWDYSPLKQIIFEYCGKKPDTYVYLHRDVSANTITKIGLDEIDLGVVYVQPNNPDYICLPFITEDILLVASPTLDVSPLKSINKITPENAIPMIRPSYAAFEAQLAEGMFNMLPRNIATNHPALCVDLVKQGFGVGLLQRTVAAKSLETGELVEVDCEYNQRPMLYKNYLLFNKRKKQMLNELIEMLLSSVN